ncbi:MAG: ComF family protein, partial [Patescibacteria group bacterium]|nr:ComF family protein [Patescibacteria group bacterium]
MSFIKFLLDLLFPINCLGCKRSSEWLCSSCREKIIIYRDGQNKIESLRFIELILVAADYNQPLLQKVLHQYKYNFIFGLSDFLGGILADAISYSQLATTKIDLVLPVPLFKKRELWRGFNQATLIAEKVAARYHWPIERGILIRKYANSSQVGLSATGRRKNVLNVFQVKSLELIKNKNILLVDDVVTTGATMESCARVLKKS